MKNYKIYKICEEKFTYLKRSLFFTFLLIAFKSNAQLKTFETDSIEVYNRDESVQHFKCKSSFVYTQYHCIMYCEMSSVYSFLNPSTEFINLNLMTFMDTGFSVDMNDSIVDVNPSDTVKLNMGVIYEVMESKMRNQVIQYFDSTGIYFIRKDKARIKFK